MTALGRKTWRDLGRSTGPGIAIMLVVGCAVAIFVGATTAGQALSRTQAAWYERARFPHLFAELRRAPERVAERIAALPGVEDVETRVAALVTLEVPGLGEPATALLCSLPEVGEPRLSKPYLRMGRMPRPHTADEVVVSEAFAEANRLVPGSGLSAVVQGRRQAYRVTGVALSPEHVFAVRPGTAMNDDRHFGILWTSRGALAAALDLEGAFDSVVVRLSRSAREEEVREAMDRLLAPYGGAGAYGRDQQTSHRLVTDEISQMRALAATLPPITLGVAAFLLSVVLSRMVTLQRPQIATLKALGYGDGAIALHYARFAAVLVLAGSAAGSVAGYWVGDYLSQVFATYYRFPSLAFERSPGVALFAALLALAGGLAGVATAVLRAVRLRPAEAMQPPAPPEFRPGALERLGLGRLLGPAGRMVLRDLSRRPLRVLLSSAGIAAALGTMLLATFSSDAAQVLVEHQFERVSRHDLALEFTHPMREEAVGSLRALPGVLAAEGHRTVPVRLRAEHRTRRTALVGLAPGAALERVVDVRRGALPVPERGLLLSRMLAERIDVTVGDVVYVEVQEGRRPVRPLRVTEVVDDLFGLQAVASLETVGELMGERRLVSGAFLRTDPAEHTLDARLRSTPAVAGISLLRATRAQLERMLDDSLVWFTRVLTVFAVVIAAGVVFNVARLAMAERERELATLRVLGFTPGEVWQVLAGEISVQLVLALPFGWLAGRGFVALTCEVLGSETMRLPPTVTASSFAAAVLVVVASTAAVLAYARRWLGRLDLVAVLKARE